MWILSHISDDAVPRQWLLVGGRSYLVGRKGSDILLEFDQAVSRKHATFKVETLNEKDINNLDVFPKISVTDEKAKYGTLVNSDRIASAATVELHSGDIIQFGTHDTCRFTLTHKPLVFCCSGYSVTAKAKLTPSIAKIGHLSDDISKCTHILMKEVRITNKLLIGLASAIPIIDETFVEDILETTDFQRSIPDGKGFLPPVLQPELKDSKLSFMVNPARQTVFEGKHFVATRNEDYGMVADIILAGGGKVYKTAKERPSARVLDTFFNDIPDPFFVVVPNAEKLPDLFNETKKKLEATKKKPSIYTIEDRRIFNKLEDIGIAILSAKFTNVDKEQENALEDTPQKNKSTKYPQTPQSESKTAKQSKKEETQTKEDPDQQEDRHQSPVNPSKKSNTSTTPQTDDEKTQKTKKTPSSNEKSPKKRQSTEAESEVHEEQKEDNRSPNKKLKTQEPVDSRKSPRIAKKGTSNEDKSSKKPTKLEMEETEKEKKADAKAKPKKDDHIYLNSSLFIHNKPENELPPSSPVDIPPPSSPSASILLSNKKIKTISPKNRKKKSVTTVSPPPSPPPKVPSPTPAPSSPATSPPPSSPPGSPMITDTSILSSPPPTPRNEKTPTPQPQLSITSSNPKSKPIIADNDNKEKVLDSTPKKSPFFAVPSPKSTTKTPIQPSSISSNTTTDSDPPPLLKKRPSFEERLNEKAPVDNDNNNNNNNNNNNDNNNNNNDNNNSNSNQDSGELKMVTHETSLMSGWIPTKRFKRTNASSSTQPSQVPTVVSFEAHVETSTRKQEWIDMEDKEMEEELKDNSKADQLFDTNTGQSIGNPHSLSPFLHAKVMSNNAFPAPKSKAKAKSTPKKKSPAAIIVDDDQPSPPPTFLKGGKQPSRQRNKK